MNIQQLLITNKFQMKILFSHTSRIQISNLKMKTNFNITFPITEITNVKGENFMKK